MKASVIIPTHNRVDSLRRTIAALKQQTVTPTDYELIVVDDGSRPAVILAKNTTGLRCTLVRLEGLERCAARNAGANAAEGELLIFVDDDMLVDKDFVDAHLRAQRDWPGALTVGAICMVGDGMAAPFRRFRESIESNAVPRARGLASNSSFCAAGNFSIPREAFQRICGFDVRLLSGEDQDLAFRHSAAGAPIVYAPDAKGLHDDTALDIRGYCKRSEWGMANMLPFIQLHPEWPANRERAAVNGPVRLGREPLSQSIRKMVKCSLANRPVIASIFALASLLEWTAPNTSLLPRCYNALLGIHIFRGYRAGLAKQGRQQPAQAADTRRTPNVGVTIAR